MASGTLRTLAALGCGVIFGLGLADNADMALHVSLARGDLA